MPFTKGQSGNPAGRPRKGQSLTEALEKALKKKREDGKKTSEALTGVLIDLAIKEKNIAAIKYIMDRIDGKPTESIEMTDGAIDQRLMEIMNGSK
jgi:hypothetical protein